MSIESSLKLLAESSARQATAMEALLAHLTSDKLKSSGTLVQPPKAGTCTNCGSTTRSGFDSSACDNCHGNSSTPPPVPETAPPPVPEAEQPPVPETPSLDIADSGACNELLKAEYERLGANPEVMQRIFAVMEELCKVRSVNDLTKDQYSSVVLAVRELK